MNEIEPMDLLAAKDTALSYIKPVTREVMKWFRTDIKVHEKSDHSPVTIADRNVEQILRKKIAADFPGFGIIGEEFGNEKPSAEWVWTIDPIDGTRSFIRGIPLFATLLSLLHHGEPVVGIIALPALGETAWAVKGKGAYREKRRLYVSQHKELSGAVIATADYYCFKTKKCLHLLSQLNNQTAINRTYPDAFGHLLAIQGSVDAMVDPWAYIWDFAPCKIMAEEAGGAFANFTGKNGNITEGTAIVGNPQLVIKIRELYRQNK